MIQRFFHPVGQGAFYSERHLFHNININIVYDCGTEYKNRNNTDIKNVVRQSFSEDDVIDILFISHFDFDHISLIDTLRKTVKRIKRVVIPLLQKGETVFLYNVYKALGEYDLAQLVNEPNKFFGEGTQIIEVKPHSEGNIEEGNIINVSERPDIKEVPSGTGLTINNLNDWVYIPFNYKYESRSKEFLCKLKDQKIDVEQLKDQKTTGTNYILDPKVIKKIKVAYEEISGDINENSMFLYSGPLYKKDIHFWRGRCWLKCFYWEHPYYSPYHYNTHRVACLYTGDGDLNKNKVDVRSIYNQYWDLIGTIQIPHHGSLPSFNANIFYDEYFICPISVGKKNSYGHPSQKVISEILLHESYPILVTEDIDSTFVEVITCD